MIEFLPDLEPDEPQRDYVLVPTGRFVGGDSITQHIASTIPVPPHLDRTRRGVPMPAEKPVHAIYQECGRFITSLQLMERVLESTLREVQATQRRWSADQQRFLRTPQVESLSHHVAHNLGQIQEYMADALHAGKQIDAMLKEQSEETTDAGPVGS